MRRSFSRFLLVLVLIAVGLLVWRVANGPAGAAGDVVLKDVSTFRLRNTAFELRAPGQVVVEAVGSVGETDSLEAFAWLLSADQRDLVWTMDARSGRRLEGTLVRTLDTLDLPAGRYELYYSSLGRVPTSRSVSARIFDRSAQWRNDHRRWYVAVRALGGVALDAVEREDLEDETSGLLQQYGDPATADTSVLWRVRSTRSETSAMFLVQDSAVLEMSVLGAGVVAARIRDSDDNTVWTLSATGTPGPRGYRTLEERAALGAGTYTLVYESNDEGPENWKQHPPVDPKAWGLTVRVASGEVSRFDPFRDLTPAVIIRGDQPSMRWTVPFEVLRPTKVVVSAMGEINSGDEPFDGGGLYHATGDAVWVLTRDESDEAGGSSKNRTATKVLTLQPGRYEARYFTDDSHHIGSWNEDSSAPEHPERYGLTLFALTPADVQAGQMATSGDPAAPPAPPSPPGELGDVLAAIENVRNDDNDEARFVLDAPGMVRVRAAAEPDDDVWITNAQGATVWTIESVQAKDGWRIVEMPLELPAGEYTAHVRADGSKAAVTFSEETGRPRSEYGIRITRVK